MANLLNLEKVTKSYGVRILLDGGQARVFVALGPVSGTHVVEYA